MIRIKRGFISRKRRTKISAYHHRKKRKTLFRNLWIHRINGATRLYGLSFNQFINFCKLSKIQLNRKILSQLILHDPESFFKELVLNFY